MKNYPNKMLDGESEKRVVIRTKKLKGKFKKAKK